MKKISIKRRRFFFRLVASIFTYYWIVFGPLGAQPQSGPRRASLVLCLSCLPNLAHHYTTDPTYSCVIVYFLPSVMTTALLRDLYKCAFTFRSFTPVTMGARG